MHVGHYLKCSNLIMVSVRIQSYTGWILAVSETNPYLKIFKVHTHISCSILDFLGCICIVGVNLTSSFQLLDI